MAARKTDERNYVSVVLTGGPCAGKSSAMSYLTQKLNDRGTRVLIVPDVATMLISGGLSDLPRLREENPRLFHEVETRMLLLQRALRQQYEGLARSFAPQKVVVLFDRAEMDVHAYLSEEEFRTALEEHRLSIQDLRDSYDLVIHLVTAANGAEEFYTTANNQARSETPEQAREADLRTLQAWVGAPHLRIVDNSTDFEGKLARVLDLVAQAAELDPPLEIERKFLLSAPPDFNHPALSQAVPIEIEQTYLHSPDPSVEVRVRRRAQAGQSAYFYTRKQRLPSGACVENEALIRPAEYLHLLAERDPDRTTIHKTRFCFAWEGRYFELDVIQREDAGPLYILEAELEEQDEPVKLPDFLSIRREVTGDPAYTNSALARNPFPEATR